MLKYPLKIAAYSGIIILVYTILYGLSGNLLNAIFSESTLVIITFISVLFTTLLSLAFNYGFVVLGQKFNNKLLTVMSIIAMVIVVVYCTIIIISTVAFGIPVVSAEAPPSLPDTSYFSSQAYIIDTNETIPPEDMDFGSDVFDDGILSMLVGFAILYVLVSLIYGVFTILFGIGLLGLKDKVEFSNVAGILNIVAGATLIIFIGWLVLLVANIFEIILLFSASKKFEK